MRYRSPFRYLRLDLGQHIHLKLLSFEIILDLLKEIAEIVRVDISTGFV